jgi:hypothetical protein
MEYKYTVLVVNGIFEDENLMVIKSKGSQYTNRFEETITSDILHRELERNGIEVNDCKLVITGTDWKGNPTITQY